MIEILPCSIDDLLFVSRAVTNINDALFKHYSDKGYHDQDSAVQDQEPFPALVVRHDDNGTSVDFMDAGVLFSDEFLWDDDNNRIDVEALLRERVSARLKFLCESLCDLSL